MENVIITGADGFIGSFTTDYFLRQGCNVLALDISEKPKRLKLGDRLTYLRCDIADPACMLGNIRNDVYDTFIHFAWEGFRRACACKLSAADAKRDPYGGMHENCKEPRMHAFCLCR